MTVSEVIGTFVVAASVPSEAVEKARIALIDTIGCAVAGVGETGTRILRETILPHSNRGDCTIWGAPERANPRDAALVNGTAAHALDFDDINWSLYGHPSVAILPAAMALGEARGATGKDVLEALSIGVQVAAKIGRFANPQLYYHGWHATCAIGAIGAAAAAARLRRLDAAQSAHALGTAASMASGLRRNFGSMVKPLHAGRAAEIGVLAADLAAGGFTADPEALEGRFGFFQVFNARSVPTPGEIRESLLETWDILDPGIVIKRYPSCGATHCALDAILALKDEYRFEAGDIAAIKVGAEQLALKVLQHSRPKSGLEGKFSMEYCMSVAAIDGTPGLDHFTDRWVGDANVQTMLPRIEVVDRADLGGERNDAVPASVAVTLSDGRSLEKVVKVPKGDPRNPFTTAELAAKFQGCVRPVLGDAAASAAWALLTRFEALPSLAPIRDALSGPARRETQA